VESLPEPTPIHQTDHHRVMRDNMLFVGFARYLYSQHMERYIRPFDFIEARKVLSIRNRREL
jgi:hypothetical protein